MTEERTPTPYVDKAVLYQQICDFQAACDKALEEGKPKPKMPDTIGAAILQIANGIASRPNFRNYTYIDEMVSDAIVDCTRSIYLFDTVKYNNPFGYLSRVVWYAFLSRLGAEKKMHETKMNMAFDPSMEMFGRMDGDDAHYSDTRAELIDFYYQGKTSGGSSE